jgi:CRP-like cAMP-binding protein
MDAILGRLRHHADISDEDAEGLTSLPHTIVNRGPGQTIVSVGEAVTHLFVIEEGWAMRHRMLSDGRRQIVNFMVPGDCFDLQALVSAKADHYVSTLTNVRLRTTPAALFLAAMRARPALATGFWWAAVQEESILREQIVRIGRRTARERVAHLILELHRRLLQTGAAKTNSIIMPLTRETMADSLGLSAVHISRTLSSLRARKLIEATGRTITLSDPSGLARLAHFNEAYLHLEEGAPRLPADDA